MADKAKDQSLRERMGRVDALLKEIDRFKDPDARVRTREIVHGLLDLHGSAIERMFDLIAAQGDGGLATIDVLASDELVASLLILYGLHPAPLEERIAQALEKVRPYLHSHGGNVELLGVSEAGLVRLRLQGSCHGCPSSAQTLKQTIEEAIYEKAPDIAAIEVEGEETSQGPALDAMASQPRDAGVRFALPILAM